MAISRLLLPKPGLHFRSREFLKSRRLLTSSPSPFSSCSSDGFDKSSYLGNQVAEKEDRAAAAESKDIREHLGIVPEEKNAGGSWVRGILTNLKEKLLWIPAEKCNKDDTSYTLVNLKAPEINMIQDECQGLQIGSQIGINSSEELESVNVGQNATEDAIQMDTSKDIKIDTPEVNFNVFKPRKEIQSSEILMPSDACEDGSLTALILHAIKEDSLENAVDVKDSAILRLHGDRIGSELVNSQSIIDCSGAVMESEADKRGLSGTHMVMENTFLDVDNPVKLSNGPEMVKPKKQYGQHEEVISATVASGRDQMSGTEDLSPLKPELNDTSRTHFKDGNQFNPRARENHQTDRQASIFIQGPKSNTKVRKRLAQSNSSLDLNVADALLTKLNVPTAEAKLKLDETVVPSESPVKGKKGLQKLDVKDLVQHVKVLCGEQSITRTFKNGNSSLVGLFEEQLFMGRIQTQARVQDSEVKLRQTSSENHATSKENKKVLEKLNSKTHPQSQIESHDENENGERMDIDINDHTQPKSGDDSPVQSCSKDLKTHSSSMEEGSRQNKVLVRYLKKDAKKDEIIQLFGNCGAIVSVEEIFFSKASKFKGAFVQFKKRKGYINALKKTDLQLEREDVLVQPACSLEETTDTISIPELIGDPEVPAALLKNPLKTVKVTQSSEISIQQLKDALAFCQRSITNIFLGSSSSVAYVEFETEDAKETAIAKHTINIPGKQFHIFRIDAPMTTVARISNIAMMDKVQSVCKSYGELKCISRRDIGIMDVHFKSAEWPKMLNILNRLNGIEVDGKKWVVLPAPVFPVEILHVLWSQAEGRRYLRSRVHSLLRKIQKPLDTCEFTDLAAYY